MLIFFAVLILLASVVLALFVLVQNPKGGGLSGTFGGFSNQTMGVRQTTDFLEKGTWVLMIIIAALCMFSSFFIPKSATTAQPGATNQNINLPTPPPAAQYPTNNAVPGQSQPATPATTPTAPPQQPAQ